MQNAEWLSWDHHRRTITLAGHMDVPLFVLTRSRWNVLNPWVPLFKTMWRLLMTKSEVIIVQNPSLILATIACLVKPFKKYKLIQDLHSYFIWIDHAKNLRSRLYRILSAFCVRHADISIVTNEYLATAIKERGGRGFVLQDKIPEIAISERKELAAAHNIVFICTYSEDEPLQEVLEAVRTLDDNFHLYVTGRLPRRYVLPSIPRNVTLTGFVPDHEYLRLLRSADALMTLTTYEYTLLCGAYEAVALSKPLIMSGTESLRDYFNRGVIFVQNERDSLAGGIREAIQNQERLSMEITELRTMLSKDWDCRFEALRREIMRK